MMVVQALLAGVFQVVQMALLLLLAAVWIGLNFTTALVAPIGSLIGAAERVRAQEPFMSLRPGTYSQCQGSGSEPPAAAHDGWNHP